MQVKRAIISVSDKTGVVELAKGLAGLGVELLSTGGTAKALRKGGLDVIDIADYTGSPEILDGRLKTLHPMVHGGILGMRGNPKHQKEMEENKIKPIDMMVVNLYPFEETVARPDCSLEDAIENIDIGGPTMLRAAAKNYGDVAVVVDPADYGWILEELKNSGGKLSEEVTFGLAQKVFALTARYDGAICNHINSLSPWERAGVRGSTFPQALALTYRKAQDLRYGENPHQKAAFYTEHEAGEPCVANIEQIHGKELSYNNIMDTDAAIEMVKEFGGQTFVAILKHTNPCGAAVSETSLADAFVKAKATDPVSAFGGIVGLSREVDGDTATAIAETFFEVVVAPEFSKPALKILQKKKNIRLLKLPGLTVGAASVRRHLHTNWNTRKVVGGLLVQDRDMGTVDIRNCQVVTKRTPTDEEYKALDFAWKICKHVKSNAIVFSSPDKLLGVGAGQMSRVDSVRIATMKMFGGGSIASNPSAGKKPDTRALVLASDAFFPFRDGVDAAAEAGATAVIQPGGSKRDQESIDAANEHNLTMIFTGMRHFKH